MSAGGWALEEVPFGVPVGWHADVHVRRGGLVRREVVLDGAGGEWEEWRRAAGRLVVAEESEPELVAALGDFLGGVVTPLSAAVGAVLGDHVDSPGVVDRWVVGHGVEFAARALVQSTRLHLGSVAPYPHEDQRMKLYWANPVAFRYERATGAQRRLREIIASCSDAEYAAVVAALEADRSTLASMVVTAYLVPGRVDWVDGAIEGAHEHRFDNVNRNRSAWELFGCAMSTVEQFTAYRERSEYSFYWPHGVDVLRTLVDALGPDAVPLLAEQARRDWGTSPDVPEVVLGALAELSSDAAFEVLVSQADGKVARPLLSEATARFPVRALRLVTPAAAGSGKNARAAEQVLRQHVRPNLDQVVQVLPHLPEHVRPALARLVEHLRPVPEVPSDALPPLLVQPPWTTARKAAKPVVIKDLPAPTGQAIAWEPGEREAWAASGTERAEWASLVNVRVREQVLADFLAGGGSEYWTRVLILEAPEDLVGPRLAGWRPTNAWGAAEWGRQVAARHDLAALPALLHLAKANPGVAGGLLLPYADGEIAHQMADWQIRLKSAGSTARAWLRRHADTAARHLVPTALGPAGASRRAAEAALRLVPDQARAAAVEHGPRVVAAIDALLSTDPLDVLPTRVPVPGPWADPAALPQILVRDRSGALPESAVRHVITTLALSTLDDVYEGVRVVQRTCDARSLAEFAWELFGRWQTAGMPAKENWVLTALGLLGDDETVRALAPVIRAWPGEGGHVRAVAGLDVLAAIGTDVALTALNGIAVKVPFKALKQRAGEKITVVAAGLGLTADQLADRLVPTLGLDDAATLTIDYGPRRFVVGFDERLKPFVVDQDGTPRKDLPKPGARDDQDLAATEHKRYTALKKDVRALAADQIARFEQAMAVGRTWQAGEFRRLFVEHPLLWHVVRRLVLVGADGVSFRFAEDRTLADVADERCDVADDTLVRIAHPIDLGDTVEAWAVVFADYEILQPFPQLGRPVHRLTDAERADTRLTRFEGTTTPVGKLLGLTKRGWQRGTPMDAGVEPWFLRPLPGGGSISVALEPGIAVGSMDVFPEQTLTQIWVDPGSGSWNPRGERTFGELDPVTASEVLADLTSLRG
ncbi:hypothetical protein Aglo01_63510 [Actinokineospora globicatena]|nr:hypothetical protein Aglo01_63510 [Actinokineospora globicatena]GLW88664.1 hypothetical protein Aglo02_63030 [Actinokineospora globicatena]